MIFAPLLPVIEGELHIGHGKAGSLFLFTGIGYGLGLFGSGFVAAHLNYRRTILISIITMGMAMVVISRLNSMSGMYAGLVLVGTLAGLYLPSGIVTLTDMIAQEHWGKAIAFHEFAPNLGFITAPFLCEALLRLSSWRDMLAGIGISSILIGILFLQSGKGATFKAEPPGFALVCQIIRDNAFWKMAALFMIAIGLNMGLYSMLPLYLVNEGGMSREVANTITGVSRLFGLIALLFSGIVSDRIGYRRAITLFLLMTGSCTLLLGLTSGGKTTSLLIFLQAFAVTCLFPAGFAFVSSMFSPTIRSVAVALVGLCGYLVGGGIIPPAIGYWAERFSFSSGFSILGVLSLSIIPFFFRYRDGKESK